MGRVPRRRMGKGIYHVINRGINNSWIFSKEEDRSVFLDLLVKHKQPFRLNVYHYVIMANHFHLAIEAVDIRELSIYLGNVCSRYSIYWHKKLDNGRGTIWQGRFKSIPVQKEGYMNRLGRYIERNPLVANKEDLLTPYDYLWSSASAYISGKNDLLVNIKQHPYWPKFGETDEERRKKYADFLLTEDLEDVKLFGGDANIIGDDDFIANLRLKDGRFLARSVGRPRKIK